MADQFENQLPQNSDAKWVRALDASGNPILISKEDLASVGGRTNRYFISAEN
jgi:GT2 family glycosyltransferase